MEEMASKWNGWLDLLSKEQVDAIGVTQAKELEKGDKSLNGERRRSWENREFKYGHKN